VIVKDKNENRIVRGLAWRAITSIVDTSP